MGLTLPACPSMVRDGILIKALNLIFGLGVGGLVYLAGF